MAVIFVDEIGSPLPVGVFVSLTGENVVGESFDAGSDYLQLGGVLEIAVAGAVAYVATLSGTQVPGIAPIAFYGSAIAGADTTVTVDGYASPTYSATSLARRQRELEVNGWVGHDEDTGDPTPQALALGVTGGLAIIDGQNQVVRSAMRLGTSKNDLLDSWVADFLGTLLPRYEYESDSLFQSRVLSAFGPKTTLIAIENAVKAFYVATAETRRRQLQPNLAFDVDGAFDERGGLDQYVAAPPETEVIPIVRVWDAQSDPTQAAQYGIVPGQFVIALTFVGGADAWFLDHSFVDFDAFLIDYAVAQLVNTAPDARLAALVQLFKAASYQPLYLITQS